MHLDITHKDESNCISFCLLLCLLFLLRERLQLNKSILLSGVVWSGSSPARYKAWPRRRKLQWPQLISDWSQTSVQLTQPGFSSTAYTCCPRTVNKPELPFRLSWDQLPLLTVLTFSHIRASQSGFQLRMKGKHPTAPLYFQLEGKPD